MIWQHLVGLEQWRAGKCVTIGSQIESYARICGFHHDITTHRAERDVQQLTFI